MILDIIVLKCKNLKYLCHSYNYHHKDNHYIEMHEVQYVQPTGQLYNPHMQQQVYYQN